MPVTISEEVRAYFTANADGVVDGVDRAKKAVASLKKSYAERVGNVKDSVLNPSGLAGKGIDKLVSSMKLSAVTAGLVGAGFEFAMGKISEFRAEAAAAKQATDALNESVRKTANANTFSTSAEGSGSLANRLIELREQDRALRDKQAELNPSDFSSDVALRTRYFENYGVHAQDHLENDRAMTDKQQVQVGKETARISGQLSESLERQAELSHQRLVTDRQTVEIADLNLQREREIAELKATGFGTPANLAQINSRYDEQVTAAEQLRTAEVQRFQNQKDLLSLQLSSLSTEQQSFVAARSRSLQIDEELRTRKFVTAEERRALILERQGADNAVRIAQRAAFSMSPGALNEQFRKQRLQEINNARTDRRIGLTDGLVNTRKDINGNITGGTDVVTGLYRGVSNEYIKSQSARNGLQTGGLVTGGLGEPMAPRVDRNKPKIRGANDQSTGKTTLQATNNLIQGVNVSNAFLHQIQVDISTLLTKFS